MSLSVGVNSYVSLDEAAAYFAGRLYTSAYTSASNADKEASLLWATKMLDDAFFWAGDKTVGGQALRWPRINAYNQDGEELDALTIPQQIKNAVCEQALYLLQIDPSQKPALLTQGFKTASAGSLSVETDDSMRPDMIAPAAIRSVVGLGTPRAGATAGGMFCGRVERV